MSAAYIMAILTSCRKMLIYIKIFVKLILLKTDKNLDTSNYFIFSFTKSIKSCFSALSKFFYCNIAIFLKFINLIVLQNVYNTYFFDKI